jgi:flagellar basal body-associated protein FliL
VSDLDVNREDNSDGEDDIDVDEILLKADPSLKQQFDSLFEDLKDITVLGESLDIDTEENEEAHKSSFKSRLFYKLKRAIKKTLHLLKHLVLRLKYFFTWLLKEGVKGLFFRLKSSISRWRSSIEDALDVIKSWSLVKRILFGLVAVSSCSATYLYVWALKTNYLNKNAYPYIGSIAELATNEFKYDPINEVEPLYGSGRVKVFVFKLKPFIVNLKRDTSGNPMGMFELAIEGSSTDVLIEIKKREPEIRDLIERVIEKKTYEVLESAQGKERLREDLRQELNFILNNGEATRIQFMNFIIKP